MRTLRPSILVLAAVAALTAGMALVAGGVRMGALFMPGVFVLGAGLVLAAIGGIIGLVSPDGSSTDA